MVFIDILDLYFLFQVIYTLKICAYLNDNITWISSAVQFRPCHPHFSQIHAIGICFVDYSSEWDSLSLGEGQPSFLFPRKLGKLPQSPHWSSAVNLIFLTPSFIINIQTKEF